MKKKTRWGRILAIALSVLVALPVGYYGFRQFVPPTKEVLIHTNNGGGLGEPAEAVAYFDYVFVAQVEAMHDMNTTKLYRQFPEIWLQESSCTELTIRVVRNIKGELVTGVSLPYYKRFGADETLTMIYKRDDDIIPEIGKYYVISAWLPDGENLGSGGMNTTVELEDGITEENLDKSKVYREFVYACAHEKISDSTEKLLAKIDHFVSPYDPIYEGEPKQVLPEWIDEAEARADVPLAQTE
ncbi:MAG: hypothetical protein LBN05_01550 [Oscillospiraceae bacterium]|nr:hypothetical protein [Oscillospiraceae bacterium]